MGAAENPGSHPSYNYAARHSHFFVLRDLNGDADCAPEFIGAVLPRLEPKLALRIAVREIEAWLLADAEAVGSFLGLSSRSIPAAPDGLAHPKQTLVEFARRARKLDIRFDMAPRPGSTATVGPAYTDRIAELALKHWRPDKAAQRSPSLSSCIRALRRWKRSPA